MTLLYCLPFPRNYIDTLYKDSVSITVEGVGAQQNLSVWGGRVSNKSDLKINKRNIPQTHHTLSSYIKPSSHKYESGFALL